MLAVALLMHYTLLRANQGTTVSDLGFFEYEDDFVNIVAWSPDSIYVASADSSGAVQVWNSYTAHQLLVYQPRHKRSLMPSDRLATALIWSPDGTKIASASYDKTVHLWDAATGERFFIYREHTDNVEAIAWSPDGTRIASGGRDRTVHVWQAV